MEKPCIANRPMTDPVRAHLLIGPLASGKTTVAWRLVERLQARGVQARRLAITEEYEKPVKRYEEPDVLQYFLILERIDDDVPRHLYSRVARKIEMVVDSTPVTRELRLRFLQGMPLPRPVHWIGWWVHTPQATCLEWNNSRLHRDRWPSNLLKAVSALLQMEDSQPCLAEGYTALVHLDPSRFADAPGHADLDALIDQVLDDLDRGEAGRNDPPGTWTGQERYQLERA